MFILWALTIFLHVILALATYRDAKSQYDLQRGLFLVGPGVWGFAVLLTGLIGVTIYWAIHHSTLRPPSNDSTE